MNNKYISKETKEKLRILEKIRNETSNCSKKEARELLLATGIYQKNGELKACYK